MQLNLVSQASQVKYKYPRSNISKSSTGKSSTIESSTINQLEYRHTIDLNTSECYMKAMYLKKPRIKKPMMSQPRKHRSRDPEDTIAQARSTPLNCDSAMAEEIATFCYAMRCDAMRAVRLQSHATIHRPVSDATHDGDSCYMDSRCFPMHDFYRL